PPSLAIYTLSLHDALPIYMAVAQKAAGNFVDTLRDTDRAMLVEFSEKVYMLSDLSNDKKHLKKLLDSTKALGGTSLYDALHVTRSEEHTSELQSLRHLVCR